MLVSAKESYRTLLPWLRQWLRSPSDMQIDGLNEGTNFALTIMFPLHSLHM